MAQPGTAPLRDPVQVTATIDDKGKVTLSPDPITVSNGGSITITFSAAYPTGDTTCDLKLKFDKFKPQPSGGGVGNGGTVSVSS
jgi:hypothetical protein